MSKSLTFDDIMAAADAAVERVECPEWSGHVFVRGITADERDRFEAEFQQDGGQLVGVRARLVAACLCDEAGKPLGLTPAQSKALGSKSASALNRIFDRCMAINGMRQSDVEEMEKNLPPADVNGSG